MAATAVKKIAAKSSPQRILVATGDDLLQQRLSRLFANEHYSLCFKAPIGRAGSNPFHLPDADVMLLDISTQLEGFLLPWRH